MVADITNVLNFEVKNANIKMLELGEEKTKLEDQHKDTLATTEQLEAEYKKELGNLEDKLTQKQEQVCYARGDVDVSSTY